MNQALALLEFKGMAAGIEAVDHMLKSSPISLLRCGSVHPGRYLALIGGSVGSTAEAHAIGCAAAGLGDDVFLPAPHPALRAAVTGTRKATVGDAVGVCEVTTAPGLVRGVDAVLKAVSVELVEVRLADDLGGGCVAIFVGELPDVQEALEILPNCVGRGADVSSVSLLPRVDETLRGVLNAGTRFGNCENWIPAGAEALARED